MCGRARCTLRPQDITRAAHVNDGTFRSIHMDRYQPSYNVAPGFNMPVIRRDDAPDGQGAVLHYMKWGLVPNFTKKTEKPDHYKMFNARSESIGQKASFRSLIPKNRCLVAVEGFYEWKKDGSKKQPYYIHLKDGRPLMFAALYDSWKNSEGEIMYTFTILTTSSASTLQWLHDRMPVILGDKESTDEWLNGSLTKYETLLKPYENSDLVWYPVTPAVGKPSFNGPECIQEVQLKHESKNQILKFFSKKENDSDKEPKTKDESLLISEFPVEDVPNTVKKESESEVKTEAKPITDKENSDLHPKVSPLSPEEASKCRIKRDFEDVKIDSKPNFGEVNKICTSSSAKKRKGGEKNTGDKQLTLTSYFKKT